jgi:hypothetical protein
MTVIEGVDYSYDPPSVSGLVAAGKRFVVRYGGVGKTGKLLTAAETTALRKSGLAVVANVEETAQAFRGAAAGVQHAKAGDAFFRSRGMPGDRPIYFSVDWAAGTADWSAVDAALRGAASVIGPDRVGVYGGYNTIAHCVTAGTATWFWQTYAWSGGKWHPACHLQQYRNNVTLAGGTVDLDRAVVPNYGQWGNGMTTAPASLLAARRFYIDTLAKAGFKVDPMAVGIVGDDNHAQSGNSYHLGKSALRGDSYTITESSRDRAGLSEAAAALDLGAFRITVDGKKHDLRSFSLWLVAQCKANTPDTADIREVIYSPDGTTVKRWDRLGKRSTGDKSHLSHTHESWFRDSESRDKTAHLKRYFSEIGVLEDIMAIAPGDLTAIASAVLNARLGSSATTVGMALQSDIAKSVWSYPLEDPTSPTGGTKQAGTYQRYLDVVARAAATEAVNAVKVVVGTGSVDPGAIANAVAGLLAPQIDAATERLAEITTDPVPPDEARRILLDALAEAFGRPPA